MNRMKERLGSLCMAVVMLLSMAVTPAMATDTQDPPTEVTNCEVSGLMLETLNLNLNDEKWLNAWKHLEHWQCDQFLWKLSSAENCDKIQLSCNHYDFRRRL